VVSPLRSGQDQDHLSNTASSPRRKPLPTDAKVNPLNSSAEDPVAFQPERNRLSKPHPAVNDGSNSEEQEERMRGLDIGNTLPEIKPGSDIDLEDSLAQSRSRSNNANPNSNPREH